MLAGSVVKKLSWISSERRLVNPSSVSGNAVSKLLLSSMPVALLRSPIELGRLVNSFRERSRYFNFVRFPSGVELEMLDIPLKPRLRYSRSVRLAMFGEIVHFKLLL